MLRFIPERAVCVFVSNCLNPHSQHELLLLTRRRLQHPALLAHPPPWQGLPSCTICFSRQTLSWTSVFAVSLSPAFGQWPCGSL